MAKTIMIVDDSASMRQVIKVALERAGFNVLEACDGKDALSQLETDIKICLIVSDINMEVMDGITFVKQVKLLDHYKFTPIIMLTTETEPGKKQEAKEAGAKAWVSKPFQPQALLTAVAKFVQP
jgi:two-component system chemotaxis response regulator CheY